MKLITILFLLLSIILLILNVSGNTSTQLSLNTGSSTKYTTACGSYTYFYVDVPSTSACEDLLISTTVFNGEADLYVSKTSRFPTNSMQTWAAFADGIYDLTISRWDPESSPGRYYIGVYADCSNTKSDATYTIRADTDDTDDGTDIYATPSLATNFALNTANSYKYFRFCIPDEDKDVTITLSNCYLYPDYTTYAFPLGFTPNSGACDSTHYTLPELIVTRNILEPTVADLGFKLATIATRSIVISASDQAGNDPNGYHSGVYYIAVQAWCTPDAYCAVGDETWCGPCSYYSNTPNMDVVVATSPGTAQTSKMSWSTYLNALSGTGNIPNGQTKSHTVTCNAYTYYGFEVPSPCYDLNLSLKTTTVTDDAVAELSVGTYPNSSPDGILVHGTSIEWTSYNWGDNELTISAFDPNFDGGYNCGPNKDELCTIIIGVYAYCTPSYLQTGATTVDFDLTPTLTRAKKIFGTPQTSQTFSSQVSGGDVNTYQFCVLDNQDVTVQLQSYYSSCQCQSKYADLEMWISKYNSEASINDLVWRVGHGTADKSLYLDTFDTDTRTGSYYLYVSGYCNSQCSSGSCSCNPCDNLIETEYAVNVDYTSSIELTNLLPSCGNKGTCDNQCDNSFELSEGAKAGIAIAVIVFSMLMGALGYIAYMKYIRKQKYMPNNSHEEVELTFQHHDTNNIRSL